MKRKLTPKEEKVVSTQIPKNVGRMLHLWKRFFDDWATKELASEGYSFFKMAYMPFIMNIGIDGSTNNEIAAKAHVSKQAMSKVVAALLENHMINIQKDEEDARVSHIYLTDKGKKFVLKAKTKVSELTGTYEKLIGKRNLTIMMDSMFAIISYHEEEE